MNAQRGRESQRGGIRFDVLSIPGQHWRSLRIACNDQAANEPCSMNRSAARIASGAHGNVV